MAAAADNPREARRRQVAWWATKPGQHDLVAMVLKGVVDYIEKHQTWCLQKMWGPSDAEGLAWKRDGILVCGDVNEIIARQAEQLQVPIVSMISNREDMPSVPSINEDHRAIGELAAEHLLERKLQHFGFCGYPGLWFSDLRRDAFARRLQQAGCPCAVYATPDHPLAYDPQVDQITQWLAGLPKPVGILCDTAFWGNQVLAACQRRGLAVPEDIAVITVKIEDRGALLETPPLSFVDVSMHRVGYEAAALLDRLMSGEKTPQGAAFRVAPLGVETRQSTDILAIPDPHVASALRYIWQHAVEGIQIKDVLRQMPQSRSLFERNFCLFVGRTPHQEIVRVRMNRAKELLTGTDLPLKQIAERAGFGRIDTFTEAFRQVEGMPPGKYRALCIKKFGGQSSWPVAGRSD